MKYSWLILSFSVLLSIYNGAQAKPWEVSLDAGLMLTQNGYSDNWAGSETGTTAWAFNTNLLAKKRLSPKVVNRNTMKLSFGQAHNQNTESKQWNKPLKSTDLIDLETLFRFKVWKPLNPYIAGRMESQFLDAGDPLQDRYVNPVKLTESVGVARAFIDKETRDFTVRTGFGLRQYINRDALDAATGKRATQTSGDAGIELVADFSSPFAAERITYTGKLSLFQAFYYSKADELEGTPQGNYWKSMDVNWENIFAVSIVKHIVVNLYTQLLYDKQISKSGRFKQTLSLGLTYKFI